jgi:hypothetical protein
MKYRANYIASILCIFSFCFIASSLIAQNDIKPLVSKTVISIKEPIPSELLPDSFHTVLIETRNIDPDMYIDRTKEAQYYRKLDSCKRIVKKLNEKFSGRNFRFYAITGEEIKNENWLYIAMDGWVIPVCYLSSYKDSDIKIIKRDKSEFPDTDNRTFYRDDLWDGL